MNTPYESVVDPTTIVWTAVAGLIHVGIIASQLGLGVFLIATGSHNLFTPTLDSKWLRRLGVVPIVREATQKIGGLRITLGIGLLLPLIAGAHFVVSLLSCVGALLMLVFLERGIDAESKVIGRFTRRTAIALPVLLSLFMLWEGEDGLEQGVEILTTARSWQVHEKDWQLSNDVEAPKVGELAPDFELQDPTGESVVRLADFRGNRPVALIFGSYT